MSVQEIFSIVADRGLKLALKDGQPVIRGDRAQVNQPLLDALKRYREAIVEHLEAESKKNIEVPI